MVQDRDPKSDKSHTPLSANGSDEQTASPKNPPTEEAIQAWLVSQLSEQLGVEPGDIDVREPFDSYGLSSTEAVILSGDLGEWLGRRLTPMLVYEYPTVEALARYLVRPSDVADAATQIGATRAVEKEPIAIIGIGCRFPGARGPEAFWQLLRDGVDAIGEVPTQRWDLRAFYDPNPEVPGKMNTRWGGFLEQVDQFDPYFFGISPREAARMDPQQRLLLEVAWEALEDAGQVSTRLAGTRTSVFIGISTNDYGRIQLSDPRLIDAYTGTGNALSIAANRISYLFDFRGPSVAVDTACSASLVAVHLACCSLLSGESSLALAGGVSLILSPAITINFTKVGLMAPDGRCKTFDARADGYVRSEGCGVVVLKPLSRALADGDPIYAVIRGSAVGHDGRTNGLLAPSRQAQEAVLQAAYRQAGVSPGQVQYVEAHGTGTFLGDPIEAEALGAVLAIGRPSGRPCAVGAVKTNIGHVEAAAGVAGLIKTALSLKHRAIPPSLHFQEPNPHIPFDELPLRVQQTLGPWPDETRPLLAGVSSFGFGGTDVHMVLEEAPQPAVARRPDGGPAPGRACLLPLSARSPEALQSLARAYQSLLATQESEAVASLQDVCYTAGARRSHHDHRLALAGGSRQELIECLEAFLQEQVYAGVSFGRAVPGPRRKIVFVFPGQGSQWIGMGRQLLEQEPIFRATLEQCDQAMRPYVDWSLLKELAADEAQSRLDEIDIIQPTLFAIEVAMATLWRSWGIEPDAVVGHSMGEVAAAHVAGALSRQDAAQIICRRSRLLKRTSGQGAMAVVGLSLVEARQILLGHEDRVSIAVSNSPASTVLSGDPARLQEIVEQLQREDIFCRWVKVDVASHSPQMDVLRADLLGAVDGVQPQSAAVPIYSTVTGQVSDGLEFTAAYWVRNLREPVLFFTAIQQLVQDGHDIFIEMSPHPILLSAIRQGLQHLGRESAVIPSLQSNKEELQALQSSLGTLYTLGYPVDWCKLYPAGGRCVPLPPYPWQRERCWLEPEGTDADLRWEWAGRDQRGRRKHPLLGRHLQSAHPSGSHFWETELSERSLPYLSDHRVQEAVLLPGTAYIEMALAATAEALGDGPRTLAGVEFHTALFVPESDAQPVQVILAPGADGEASFHVYSRSPGEEPRSGDWVLHASGEIRAAREGVASRDPEPAALEAVQARCPKEIPGDDLYARLEGNGLQYGPCFRGIERVWLGDGEALGQLRVPPALESEVDAYWLHPAVLDAAFQVLAAATPDEAIDGGGENLYLPIRVDQVRVYGRPARQLWSHARLRPNENRSANTVEGDFWLLDEAGGVVAEVSGLRLQRLDRGAPGVTLDNVEDWFYELQWQPLARPPADSIPGLRPADRQSSWLIFADATGVAPALQSLLAARGETCVMVSPGEVYERLAEPDSYRLNPAQPEDFRRLLQDAFGPDRPPCGGMLHLWSLDAAPPEETTLASLETAQALGCISVLHLLQAIAATDWIEPPRLWLATRGAQAVGSEARSVAVAQAPLWGLGRVVAREHPELCCTNVDLGAAGAPEEIQSLFQELWLAEREDQVALRGLDRYVARLTRFAPSPAALPESVAGERTLAIAGETPFRLEISEPGILDNLALRATSRRAPGPGEVEIQVCASGLNFRDVMKALGLYPDLPDGPVQLGDECAGRIAALGEGVAGFQVGDEVIAIAPACFGAFTTTPASLVVPKPAHLSFEEAATIPVAFLTASYALYHLGRLDRGERVLIHAASGGVGLAAVQLAQRVGAEVYATAGSPEKREFLRSLGVKHVMDSRSLAFADEVMEHTGGEGVDVVLNSLSGKALARSLSTLGAHGRFLEIGKRDIYQNGQLDLQPFQKSLSFSAIDIDRLCRERPAFVGALLREIVQYLAEGALRPLPLRVFPVAEVVGAFRYMAQAKHIGKIVIALRDQEDVWLMPSSETPVTLRPDSTYLITGGLGGLGLTVAQWMVQQGVRHLVLAGRSGASAEAQQAVEAMEKAGAQIVVVGVDVVREDRVANVLAEIERTLPPLRGVIHAAGILDDGILLQLDRERFKSVMAPKVSGAWNLHTLTRRAPLDLFVLFSSAASLLGSPGQGNYAAANAFLDALAHDRRVQGLPALSINWGPWAQVGLAAQPDRGGRLASQGFGSIAPEKGLEVLERLLPQDSAQVVAMPVNWQRWRQFDPAAAESPLLAHLLHEGAYAAQKGEHPQKSSAIREALLAAEPGEHQQLLESYLSEQVAKVVGTSVVKLDVSRSFTDLGIDSMMSVELKNRIRIDLGREIPIVELFRHTTIGSLARYLSQQEDERSPHQPDQDRAEAIKESRERQRTLRQRHRAAKGQRGG
jgi:acyl transferase domain-containing protein/acyl carrier protein